MEIQARQRRKYTKRIAPVRRRDLIQATIRDISAHGYDQVTVASICEEAGFSRGLIGHYFSSKNELLLEAVKTVADQIGAAFQDALATAGKDPRARLHALIAASFRPPAFTAENVAVWVSLVSAARWSPQLAKVYRTIWLEYRAGVARLVGRAAAGSGVKADRVALTFSQMVEGFWIGLAADPQSVSPEEAEECCHAYIDLILPPPVHSKSTR
ncbi:MAG: transcriptional regulator BetI [Pseudorhodoplanes sp.]